MSGWCDGLVAGLLELGGVVGWLSGAMVRVG